MTPDEARPTSPPSDLTDNIDYLPIWKKGSTAAEWLMELYAIARKTPERFEKCFITYHETLKDGSTVPRYATRGATTTESLGMIELAKHKLLEDTNK